MMDKKWNLFLTCHREPDVLIMNVIATYIHEDENKEKVKILTQA